jgi:flagellar hook-associated protein 1 FlgK
LSSSFGGLQIAYSALKAQQQIMETTSHNISNVSTTGYTRQRVNLSASPPTYVPSSTGSLEIGTGVKVDDITRVMDQFVNSQLRDQTSKLTEKENSQEVMSQVETIFNEPSDSGLGTAMTDFWNSWEQLSLNPESLSSRQGVISQAQTMTQAFNSAGSQLKTIQSNLDAGITQNVDQINSLANQLADLNTKISRLALSKGNTNDLEDSRDQVITKLQNLLGGRVLTDSDGEVSLYIGNRALVQREKVNEVESVTTTGVHNLAWSDDGAELQISGGKIASIMEMRDTYVPGVIQKLDDLVSPMITQVNSLHSTGYDLNGNAVSGTSFENFFTGTSLDTIAVNTALVNDPSGIAAGATSSSGDADNATSITALKDKQVISSTYTFGDYYASVVARVGVDVQGINDDVANATTLQSQIKKSRESISGVSIDEETVNLTEAQKAYEAAAHALSVMDAALDVLINKLGTSS